MMISPQGNQTPGEAEAAAKKAAEEKAVAEKKAAEEAAAKKAAEEKAAAEKKAADEAAAKKAAEDLKKAEWLALPAKRAMIDLGAAFTYSSKWDDSWTNPTLNGPIGWHGSSNIPGHDKDWVEVDMPGDDLYLASKLSW